MNANDAVALVIDALNAAQIPYMLAGGYAANFHGVVRATKDADFVLQTAPETIPTLASRLAPQFRFDPQFRIEAVTATPRFVFALVDSPFIIEFFLLTADAHDQARFTRRIATRAWDRDVFIPTAEDLLITKLRWSRGGRRRKDHDDARDIIAVHAHRLDWPYIEHWCDQHDTRELLEQVRRDAPYV